jgi:hypothetical protein
MRNLSAFAKKYLTLSATSSSVERCWSLGRNIVGDYRHQMTSQNFENVILLKFNEEFL